MRVGLRWAASGDDVLDVDIARLPAGATAQREVKLREEQLVDAKAVTLSARVL